MAQAGISDKVIVSYIQNSPVSYSLSADQIVYLGDLGISSTVLQALMNHRPPQSATSAAPAAGAATESATAPSVTESSSSSVPASPRVSPNAQGPALASLPPAARYFYSSLAPYGTWLDLPRYGWCWQPTAAAVNPGWQPYCNDGYWLWTNNGWYWNSYYSWGWAPFHYGRWFQYPGYGWLWEPNEIWGPAWVCWRVSPAYCGWAPLPPGAYFTAGLGWFYNGVYVGFDFDFGLAPYCFTFVDYDHFCDRHPFDHFHHGRDADGYFRRTRPHNDFVMGPHHTIFDRSINPRRIEAVTHRRLREVAVRELPRGGSRFTMPGRLVRSGNSSVIFRPNPRGPAPHNVFLPAARTRQEADLARNNAAGVRMFHAGVESRRGATLLMPHMFGRESRNSRSAVRSPTSRPNTAHLNGPFAQRRSSTPSFRQATPGRSPEVPRSFTLQRFSGGQRSFRVYPGFREIQPLTAPHYGSFGLARSRPFSSPMRSSPRMRTFSQPRQSFRQPTIRAPSFARPTRSFGGARSFGSRGGGFAMNRGGRMRASRR